MQTYIKISVQEVLKPNNNKMKESLPYKNKSEN